MHFSSDRLREARRRANLTQKQLAEQAGVGLRSLVIWEKGGEPSPENLRKICSALHIDFHEFYHSDLHPENLLVETGHEHDAKYWKQRAQTAEKQLHDFKNAVRSVLEMASQPADTDHPAPANVQKSSSLADQVSKADVEAALSERKGKADRHPHHRSDKA